MILDYGHPVGGHAYPARLSFVLWGNGVPLALQPGSPFWYHDPMYRKWYRTTMSHNTVVVNGRSQQTRQNGRNVFGNLLNWFDGTRTAAVQPIRTSGRSTTSSSLRYGQTTCSISYKGPGRSGSISARRNMWSGTISRFSSGLP